MTKKKKTKKKLVQVIERKEDSPLARRPRKIIPKPVELSRNIYVGVEVVKRYCQANNISLEDWRIAAKIAHEFDCELISSWILRGPRQYLDCIQHGVNYSGGDDPVVDAVTESMIQRIINRKITLNYEKKERVMPKAKKKPAPKTKVNSGKKKKPAPKTKPAPKKSPEEPKVKKPTIKGFVVDTLSQSPCTKDQLARMIVDHPSFSRSDVKSTIKYLNVMFNKMRKQGLKLVNTGMDDTGKRGVFKIG